MCIRDSFWAFSGRASFWAIFEKFPLVFRLRFFRKCGFLGYVAKIAITWPFGHFWSRWLRGNLFQSLHFRCILIRGLYQLRESAFRPLKRGHLFGRFLKKFLWSPLCTFLENAGFDWSRENGHNFSIRALLEPLFTPKLFPVFALLMRTNYRIMPFAQEFF